MKLILEEFLKSHSNWEELLKAPPYSLAVMRDGEYVLFKYNQFESDMSLRICQESRGIIFHEPTLTPVCVPFLKFFNYGEPNAAEIDWNTNVITTEKIDGSLMKLWFHNGKWHLSTNGTIDAWKARVGDTDETFGKLFEDALDCSYDKLISNADPWCTYMLELVHSKSEIVIHYDTNRVYVLAQRDMGTYEELKFLDPLPGTYRPKKYNLHNMDDIVSVVNGMNENHEGIVVCDSHFNRIKVKSPLYLVRAHAYNNDILTDKRILKLWRADMLDDFLAYVPKKREQVEEVLKLLEQYVNRQESIFKEISHIENRKEFVEMAKRKNGDISYMVNRKDSKIARPIDYLKNHPLLPSIIRVLEKERNRNTSD